MPTTIQRLAQETRYPMRQMLSAARCRARNKSLPFSLALTDLHALAARNEGCAYCGVRMAGHNIGADNKRNPNARSLDRVIPANGYVTGNIVLACRNCNEKKGRLTPTEMREMADRTDQILTLEGHTEKPVYEVKFEVRNLIEHNLVHDFMGDINALRSVDEQLELGIVADAITLTGVTTQDGELN